MKSEKLLRRRNFVSLRGRQLKNKNWKRAKLGEVANVNMGQSPSSKYYNLRGDGLPFYQGVTDFGEKYLKKSTYCTNPTKIADSSQILFSVRAPVGEVNIATEKCCIGRGVAALSIKNGNNDFLYFLLKNYVCYFKNIAGEQFMNQLIKTRSKILNYLSPKILTNKNALRLLFLLLMRRLS